MNFDLEEFRSYLDWLWRYAAGSIRTAFGHSYEALLPGLAVFLLLTVWAEKTVLR